jgi:sulfatase modifying factor 1
MRRVGIIAVAVGLATALVGIWRHSPPAQARPTLATEDGPIARPASTEAMVALRDAPQPAAPEPTSCGEGMALVEGNYCPDVRLNCKRYLDGEGRYQYFRCAEYAPSTCLSKERKAMRFCIDKREFTEQGETLPANHRSWRDGDRTCRKLGKRMCMESEYNFACEGENMQPYPYGFTRDATACNADRDDVVSPQGTLRDLRAPSGSYERCVSPFGVADLAGNLEEFVTIDHSTPARPAMKGSYWQPGRNFCRAAQTAHDMYYNGTETGFRCCSDAAH